MANWDDYNRGKDNPNELPGSGPINWDFQQGQFDALKELQDKLNPPIKNVPTTPGTANNAPAYSGPPFIPLKSMIAAVVLPFLLGPLGLFYASAKAAFMLIGILLLGPMLTGTMENAAVMLPLLQLSYVVSIVWSIVAVQAHNRRAARNNAQIL